MLDKIRKRVKDHASLFKYDLTENQIDEIVVLYELNNDFYDDNQVSLHVENFMNRINTYEYNKFSNERRKTVFARRINNQDFIIPNFVKNKGTFDFLYSRLGSDIPFCLLSNEQKSMLVQSMYPLIVEKGTVLIKEGAVGEQMYIVEEGEFDVTVKENFKNKIKSGDVFGELALLHGICRTATVTATKKSKIWSAEQTSFSCIRIRDQIYRKDLMKETLENSPEYTSIIKTPEFLNKIIDHSKNIFIDADSPFEIFENEMVIILKKGTIDDGEIREVNPKDILRESFHCITDLECVLVSFN